MSFHQMYGELEHFYQEVQAVVNGSVARLPHFALEPFAVQLISDLGIDAVLDFLWNIDEPYMLPSFKEELYALANSTGIDIKVIQRLVVGPEFTKAGCSMLGAWGSVTPTGDLLQLRALDWSVMLPLCVFVVLTYTQGHGRGDTKVSTDDSLPPE
jgi:hypothetical protein